MDMRRLDIPDVVEFMPKKHGDDRGFFAETYSERTMRDLGFDLSWVQDNQSLSTAPFTLRGLHFQTAPEAQHKLIRVLRGSIFDVAIDLRKNSPTFGKWCSAVLSAENFRQLLIPIGFAHGFLTLEPNTEVLYKVSAGYAPACDRGIRFDDPAIGVNWPLQGQVPQLSGKDAKAPHLSSLNVDDLF